MNQYFLILQIHSCIFYHCFYIQGLVNSKGYPVIRIASAASLVDGDHVIAPLQISLCQGFHACSVTTCTVHKDDTFVASHIEIGPRDLVSVFRCRADLHSCICSIECVRIVFPYFHLLQTVIMRIFVCILMQDLICYISAHCYGTDTCQ